MLARGELVAELERTGQFRAQARLVVPASPRRIGLVSSPGTAGRADVVEILNQSPAPLVIVDVPAPMSGPAAPAMVARAVGLLAEDGVDVVLIARGGGAKSDLAAWESRLVALAITSCPVVARAQAAQAALGAEAEKVERLRHAEELAASKARARRAVLVSVVVVLVVVLVVVASRL